jgi:hypothetical protein
MSYEATLRALIETVFTGGAYPDTLPEHFKSFPAAVYQQVGGSSGWYVDDTVPDDFNARVQITMFGKDRAQVNAMARSLERVLAASSLVVRPVSALVGDYDDAQEVYIALQDYNLWYYENMPTPEPPTGDVYGNGAGDQYVDHNGDNYVGS